VRILLISDHADPLAEVGSKEAGGQNIFVYYLASFLGRLGVSVDVFTRWDKKNKKEVVHLNNYLRVIRVKAGPKRYIPRDSFLDVVDEFAENILKRIKQEKNYYDIIHTNYWFSGIIGLKITQIIKRPLVHVYHSIGQVRFDSLSKLKLPKGENEIFKKRLMAEKEIARKADRIIATSPVEKKIIKKLFRINEKKIDVITIGVDTKIFKPIKKGKARKLLGFENKKKIIIYVGRIEWRKGIGTLIYAFREVVKHFPKSKLYIIGGGNSKAAQKLDSAERERLKNIIKELNLGNRVSLLGSKKQKKLYQYYSASDVCVVPSYYEPFGIVPLESMACGTPVVASKTGGLQFSVKDGITGHLAKPRNYKDLAKKIITVLKNGKNFYKINCLKRIDENFLWKKIAEQYKDYFNQFNIQKK